MGDCVHAIIALGSNLGDSWGIVSQTLERLQRQLGIKVLKVSPWYRTQPVGPPQPDYLNGCVRIATALDPFELLAVCQNLEHQANRQRSQHWGPRTLDLDLILYGDLQLSSPILTLPHPRFRERAFVLVPLVDLEPNGVDPVTQISFQSLLAQVPTAGIAPWFADGGLETRPGVVADTIQQEHPQSPQSDGRLPDSQEY